MDNQPKKDSTPDEINAPSPEEMATTAAELRAARWAVISFEKCEAGDLTYPEAEQKLAELQRQKIAGLCLVTNEAAAKIAAR